MKKILAIVLMLVISISTVPAIALGQNITINVEGIPVVFPDAQPFVDVNNRTQVPIGALAQIMGVETKWDSDTNTAYISAKEFKDSRVLKIIIGDNKLYIGEKSYGDWNMPPVTGFVFNDKAIEMDTAAILINDRTFIPIRYVADFFAYNVEWDAADNSINLVQKIDAFKGIELYIWKDESNVIQYNVLPGTNRNKTQAEIYNNDTATSDFSVLKSKLDAYDDDTYIFVFTDNIKTDELAELKAYFTQKSFAVSMAEMPSEQVLQNTFDLKLLSSMPKDKNYMISPFSLKMALAMAANGAEGETKHELLDVLGISDLEQYNKATKDFIENSNKNEGVEFNIANSIWHNTSYYKDDALGLHSYWYGPFRTGWIASY